MPKGIKANGMPCGGARLNSGPKNAYFKSLTLDGKRIYRQGYHAGYQVLRAKCDRLERQVATLQIHRENFSY